MTETALILIVLFCLKHWYIDFVNQTQVEVDSKGIYGQWRGILHSVKHAVGTVFCLWVIGGNEFFLYGLLIGIIEGTIHYHIDWAKMNWGNRDMQTTEFWNHLGFDQMLHHITYIIITYLVVAI